jgi:hypothetical protein
VRGESETFAAEVFEPFARTDQRRVGDVLYEGRAARIHVLCNGRAASGGLVPAAREQFATVILARVGVDTWQQLAPIAGPASKNSTLPGAVHVIQDGTAHQTQLLLLTDAADWLTAMAAGERRSSATAVRRATASTTPCGPSPPATADSTMK